MKLCRWSIFWSASSRNARTAEEAMPCVSGLLRDNSRVLLGVSPESARAECCNSIRRAAARIDTNRILAFRFIGLLGFAVIGGFSFEQQTAFIDGTSRRIILHDIAVVKRRLHETTETTCVLLQIDSAC